MNLTEVLLLLLLLLALQFNYFEDSSEPSLVPNRQVLVPLHSLESPDWQWLDPNQPKLSSWLSSSLSLLYFISKPAQPPIANYSQSPSAKLLFFSPSCVVQTRASRRDHPHWSPLEQLFLFRSLLAHFSSRLVFPRRTRAEKGRKES